MTVPNLEQKSWWKLGPNFGLTVRDPQSGVDGTDIYSQYAYTDDGDQNVFGLSNGSGICKLYNDRSIEIVAGQNNSGGGIDIEIVSKHGDICITAEKNGNVRIRAKNITLDADENLNIVAGKNVNIRAGKRFVVQANQADCIAKTGNIAPKGTSSGERIYGPECKNGVDSVETAFNAGEAFDQNRKPFDLEDLFDLFR